MYGYARIHPPTHLHIFNDYERHQIFTPFVFVFVVIFSVFLVFYYSFKIQSFTDPWRDDKKPRRIHAICNTKAIAVIEYATAKRRTIFCAWQKANLPFKSFFVHIASLPNAKHNCSSKKKRLRRNEAKKRCQNSTLNIFLQNVLRIFFKCVN